MGPAGPVSCLGSSSRAAESQSSVPAVARSRVSCPPVMFDNCRNTFQIAASCCLANSSDDPGYHSEEKVCPGNCAEQMYQPRALNVWHGDALQEEAVFLELASQLGFHELLMSQGGPQHDNSLLVIWEHVVATPHDHGRSHLPARLEDVLATKRQETSPAEQLRFAQVGAKCPTKRFPTLRRLPRCQGFATTQMSSKNAKIS